MDMVTGLPIWNSVERRFGLNPVAIWQGNCLWKFLAVQQFRADPDIGLCRKALIVKLALMVQIALPNRTTSRYARSGFSPNRLRAR
jgi:hypothetical protein